MEPDKEENTDLPPKNRSGGNVRLRGEIEEEDLLWAGQCQLH